MNPRISLPIALAAAGLGLAGCTSTPPATGATPPAAVPNPNPYQCIIYHQDPVTDDYIVVEQVADAANCSRLLVKSGAGPFHGTMAQWNTSLMADRVAPYVQLCQWSAYTENGEVMGAGSAWSDTPSDFATVRVYCSGAARS